MKKNVTPCLSVVVHNDAPGLGVDDLYALCRVRPQRTPLLIPVEQPGLSSGLLQRVYLFSFCF